MKIIQTGQQARESLKKGIDLVANAIKVTLGPAGRNAVIGNLDRVPTITNDGATIARNIESEDEFENQGVWMVKESSALTDNKSGDGTTTNTVILQALVQEGFNRIKDDGSLVSKKVDTIALKREVDEWCEKVVARLNEMARPITSEDIYNVAIVSGEYEWLATMITEIFKKIGKDGYVTIEEANKNGYEIFKGLELKAGYHSDYYISEGNENKECILQNPFVLVTNQALDISAGLTLVEIVGQTQNPRAIIIAPDFTKDLLNRLTTTKLKANLDVVALKLPTFDKDDLLVDIATVTQAKFFDKNTYTKYEDLVLDIKLENLGTVDKAIVTDSKSVLIDGKGDTTDRIKEIQAQIEKTTSVFDKDKLEQRIAFLSGGIAILKIGGESEFEKMYFKLKAEDAVNAVQIALKDGVVAGGGLALKQISEEFEQNILTSALIAPYNQIQENAGVKLEIADSVIDPVRTTISAIKTACSIAGMVLTTEVVTAYKNESKDKNEN